MQCCTVQPLYFFTINNHIGITLADDWMIMIKHTVKLHVSREKKLHFNHCRILYPLVGYT